MRKQFSSKWTWRRGCAACVGEVSLGLSVPMSPHPQQTCLGPCTVIPDCPQLKMAVLGGGPREEGEVELLGSLNRVSAVPQGILQLKRPSELRPEGWACYASHRMPPGWRLPPLMTWANSSFQQRVIPRECWELTIFPEAGGMRPSVRSGDLGCTAQPPEGRLVPACPTPLLCKNFWVGG